MTDTSDAIAKIRAGELLSDAFGFTSRNYFILLKLAFLPLMMAFVFQSVPEFGLGTELPDYLGSLVHILSTAVFSVAVHRFYILGAEARLGFGPAEVKFAVLLLVATYLPSLMTGILRFSLSGYFLVYMVLHICIAIISTYLILRLSLVFPSAALSAGGSIITYAKNSWRHMRGRAFSLFLALFAVMIIYLIAEGIVMYVISPPDIGFEEFVTWMSGGGVRSTGIAGAVVSLIRLCISFFITLITVLFVSNIYKTTQIEAQACSPLK